MSFAWSFILAAGVERKMGTWNSPVLWTTLVFVGVLLLGALVVAVVKSWRKKSAQDRSGAGDQLSHFRSLYDRGELTREEFEKIRGKLGTKLRQDMKVPAAAKPESPVPPESSATTGPPAEAPRPPDPPVNGTPSA